MKPIIHKENGLSTFIVDGKPFLSLGGELHNSSSSSPGYLRTRVWPKLRSLRYNSVIASVSWEQIEPEKGLFDFSVVDELLKDARENKIKLILIWFGLWKNGESTYVPGWMKKNPEQYWKCTMEKNTYRVTQTISPLCSDAIEADALAFSRLMKHIRENDTDYTVIMMQVQNEMGLIGSARDLSPLANDIFAKKVPKELSEAYQVAGDWKTAFGENAEEYFMAWHYAKATELIATAGTKEHPIPMYVNAWLSQFPDRAGYYPSGGPIARVMKLWRLAAPTICLYAPDVYVPYFERVCAEYTQDENPLFIPETRCSIVSAASVFLAVGKYNALGFHPFGIEDMFEEPDNPLTKAELAALNIDPSAMLLEGAGEALSASYGLLLDMWDVIVKYRGTKHLSGFYQNSDEGGCIIPFEKYDLEISYNGLKGDDLPAGGIAIELSENEFIVAGVNFQAQFLPKVGDDKCVDFITIQEGSFESGKWVCGRILNGDEQRIRMQRIAKALRVEVLLRN